MMLNDTIDKENYLMMMKALRELNKDYSLVLQSKEYRIGSTIDRSLSCLKRFNIKSIQGYIWNLRAEKKFKTLSKKKNVITHSEFNVNQYFTNDRIAVYSCIIGSYDSIQEPLVRPNNVDYYLITDQPINHKSAWKIIDANKYVDSSLSNSEKNRYFKMHPEIVFNSYRYSIYIDGNIKVITDLTPYISLIGKYGIAMHCHSERDCAYDELMAIVYAHKSNSKDVSEYSEYLERQHFPHHYGLLECNFIVRDHTNHLCNKIMNEWFEQFKNYIKRDQVSLPYILFKNNIQIADVATLTGSVYDNLDIRIVRHKR